MNCNKCGAWLEANERYICWRCEDEAIPEIVHNICENIFEESQAHTDAADEILAAFRKAVEGVPNPFPVDSKSVYHHAGFEIAVQTILKLLGGE